MYCGGFSCAGHGKCVKLPHQTGNSDEKEVPPLPGATSLGEVDLEVIIVVVVVVFVLVVFLVVDALVMIVVVVSRVRGGSAAGTVKRSYSTRAHTSHHTLRPLRYAPPNLLHPWPPVASLVPESSCGTT